jgi:hypothetical protein
VPVIIIGAPRSGTNMLRNILSSLDKIDTWPFDEINFMWRHGHSFNSSDEFLLDTLDIKKINFMRNEFNKISRIYGSNFVLEKTCANTLRIQYVKSIFPEAKFIFIFRNKYDAIESIARNWKLGPNSNNFFKKLTWYRYMDLMKFVINTIPNIILKTIFKKKFIWGPKLLNFSKIIQNNNFHTIATYQWYKCYIKAKNSISSIDSQDRIIINYEEFVQCPQKFTENILDFLKINYESNQINNLVQNIFKDDIGKGLRVMSSDIIKEIDSTISKLDNKVSFSK